MRFKNKILTFKRVEAFDGMTDSMIPGDNSIVKGKCVDYHRSGWHRAWYIIEEKTGKEMRMCTTFDELIAVDGKEL